MDPMGMPSMHRILDRMEFIILDSMQGSQDPKSDENRRRMFLNRLYAPTLEAKKLNGDGYKPVPAGFENPEDVETAFDAFAGADAP